MTVDALLELLERDAEAEAAKLLSVAEHRAEDIRSRADAEARSRREEALKLLEEGGRRAVACETAAAARRFRESRLQERAQVLERIFAEAEQELRSASPERYGWLLPELLRETLRFLEGTPSVIHCRPEVAPLLEQMHSDPGALTVSSSAEAAAGILGETADGAVVVDNTLPALLRRRQAELAVAVTLRLESAGA